MYVCMYVCIHAEMCRPCHSLVYTVALLLIKQVTKEEKSKVLLIEECGH